MDSLYDFCYPGQQMKVLRITPPIVGPIVLNHSFPPPPHFKIPPPLPPFKAITKRASMGLPFNLTLLALIR